MFVCTECGSSQPGPGRCATDGTALAPIGEDVLLGTTIGAYRVARLLGIGGMGRVYKGVHPGIGSRVAIKVLSRECSDRRDLVERFFAEAKAVNLIRHESIVNVLDLATLPDGRPYIVMEYLDGAPLSAIIEHGVEVQVPLPLGGIARLAAEVLDALGAAHAKGIVHRDLKPDNLFVAPSGRPKVLDFGIAKLSDVNSAATRTGSLMGTPHYMSSEQAAGRPVDHRADIYAMGVILFECATGLKPFQADALFDLLRMHVEAPPPSPRALRPDMPPDFEQVILTALAKQPDQRFASAMAMSMALQHATSQLPSEHWRALQPPSARAPSTGSWAPTPPVSWTGNASPAPPPPSSIGHAATLPSGKGGSSNRPTVPARPSGAAISGDPATVPSGPPGTFSDGQVTKGTKPGTPPAAKRALWLGLTMAVVGSGIAAATVLNKRHAASDEEATRSSEPDTPSKDPWSSGPGRRTGPAEPPAPPHPPGKPPGADDDDDADDAEAAATAALKEAAKAAKLAKAHGGKGAESMDEGFQQLDEAIRSLPPAQQKQLAAYRGLGKLPPKERMKRLQSLAKQGIPGLDLSGLAELAELDEPVEAPEPREPHEPPKPHERPTPPTPHERPAPPTPPGPPGPPGPPVAWIKSHDIDPPSGYDASNLDVAAFVPWAIAQARKTIPDAQLIRIDTNGVSPNGRANLNLASHASPHGSIDVRFISPSRGKRDPSQPLGVGRRDFKCEFRIMATPDGVEMMPIDFADCSKEHPVPAPKCSFAAVWKKAIQRKAPSDNAVGNVDYRSNGSKPVWYFAIGSGFDVVFSQMFGDDC